MAMAAGCTSEFCALVCTRLFERIRLRADPATWHGQLSFAEIAEGFKMLKLKPRINLTEGQNFNHRLLGGSKQSSRVQARD